MPEAGIMNLLARLFMNKESQEELLSEILANPKSLKEHRPSRITGEDKGEE